MLYPALMSVLNQLYLVQVHHIDPEGNDSGVVYSEMQGRQNTSADIASLKCVLIVKMLLILIWLQNATVSEPSWDCLPKRNRWVDGRPACPNKRAKSVFLKMNRVRRPTADFSQGIPQAILCSA
jgi:hypothetical protein